MTHPLAKNGNGKHVATSENSVTIAMAERFGMDPRAFELTVRQTCGCEKLTREELAAFLMVCRDQNLNPITREIYAMPKRGGGFLPVVSIDGWLRKVNEHPMMDGMEFVETHDGDKLISTTCRLYRKDRSKPVEVTEYLEECKRDTDPWKMKHRMLRHKAMIQCGRYAFGFAGIYDEDEARVIAGARDVTPVEAPPAPRTLTVEPEPEAFPELPPFLKRNGHTEAEEISAVEPFSGDEVAKYLYDLESRYEQATSAEDADDIHGEAMEHAYPRMLPMDTPKAERLYQAAVSRISQHDQ